MPATDSKASLERPNGNLKLKDHIQKNKQVLAALFESKKKQMLDISGVEQRHRGLHEKVQRVDDINAIEHNKEADPLKDTEEFVAEMKRLQERIFNQQNYNSLSAHEKQMLNLIHKLNGRLGGDESILGNIATDQNIQAIKNVIKVIMDHRLHQTNRLRKFISNSK